MKLASLSFLFFISINLHSQSITEQAGGVKTEFIITSDTREFNIEDQVLIKRTTNEFVSSGNSGYTYDAKDGYSFTNGTGIRQGFSYQAFHLEFSSALPMIIKKASSTRKVFYSVKLFDDQNNTLVNTVIEANMVRVFTNQARPILYTYSINLKDIPLVLLDKTSKVDIVQHD